MQLSIRVRMVLAVAAVFIVGGVAVGLFVRQSFERSVQDEAHEAVARAQATFEQLQRDDTEKLTSALVALGQDPRYQEAFAARDREALLAVAAPVFASLKDDHEITHWYFETPQEEGTVFLRVHKPTEFGDHLERKTYLKAVDTQKTSAGLELGKTAVALRAVRPYYASDGSTLLGYMELGQEIDRFLGDIKNQTGDDVGLLLYKKRMDEKAWADYRAQKGLSDNWGDQKDYVVAAVTSDDVLDDTPVTKAPDTLPDGGVVLGTVKEGDSTEVHGVYPIKDAAGQGIGVVYVSRDITAEMERIRDAQLSILGAVLAMMALVMVVVVVLMNSLVFDRLDAVIVEMEDMSTRVAGGDFDVEYEASGRADEIGRFEDFLGGFIGLMANTLKQLAGSRDEGGTKS